MTPPSSKAHSLIREWRESRRDGDLRYVRITVATGDWIAGADVNYLDGGEPKPPFPVANSDESRVYIDFINFYIHQVNLLRHLLGEDYSVTFADAAGLVMGAQSDSGVTCLLELRPFDVVDRWYETALVAFERATVTLSLPAPLASAAGSVDVRTRRWPVCTSAPPCCAETRNARASARVRSSVRRRERATVRRRRSASRS